MDLLTLLSISSLIFNFVSSTAQNVTQPTARVEFSDVVSVLRFPGRCAVVGGDIAEASSADWPLVMSCSSADAGTAQLRLRHEGRIPAHAQC